MEYYIHIGIFVSIYGILALAQNLVMGYTGLLTIAGAAFYGIGAYAMAILSLQFGWEILPILLVAPLLAGAIALGVGATFSRFRDDYFMLATLGFLMIFHTTARNWEALTGGAHRIPRIPKPKNFHFVFDTPDKFLLLALGCLLLVTACTYFISRSSFGRTLKSIREDEDALKIFGYRPAHFKLIAFTLGAAISAVAGVIFAGYLTYIDPRLFTVNESILLWAIILLGGIGTNRGALLGAFLLIALPEMLRFVGFPAEVAALLRQMIYGLVLVLCMLFRPQGILGNYKL